MSTGRRVCETLHLVALGVWTGALVTAGATAAIVFPAMRGLRPTVELFRLYEGDHATLAAGYVQNRVFAFVDGVQFVAAAVALGTMIALLGPFGLPLRRVSTALRVVGLGTAVLLVSYQLFVLGPRMAANLREFYRLAESGQNESAELARAAFSADHPRASNVLVATAATVLATFGAGCWSASGGGPRRGEDAGAPYEPAGEG